MYTSILTHRIPYVSPYGKVCWGGTCVRVLCMDDASLDGDYSLPMRSYGLLGLMKWFQY